MTLQTCDAVVDSLLSAVRRRLWLRRLVQSARFATWASVVLMLVAVAVIYFAKPAQRAETVLIALSIVWAAALGWTVLRPPSRGACALWVDRHLGGASAYSTLLDIRCRGLPEQSHDAADSLARWLAASVPDARRRLNAQRNPAHLGRPVLLMIMSAALLMAVLTLPGVAPGPRVDPAASPVPARSDTAVPQAPLESAGLGNELEAALKKERSRSAGALSAAADSADPRDTRGHEPIDAPAGRAQAQNATGRSENTSRGSARESVGDAPARAGSASAARASGREAGEARDDGTDRVASRPSGAISIKQQGVTARSGTAAREADMTQSAAFEDEHALHAGTRNMPPPIGLPALAPAGGNTIPLTPTQAAYVQAWLQTQGHR